MDPSPENNRAAGYQGPMKLEVVKSCGATQRLQLQNIQFAKLFIQLKLGYQENDFTEES